MRKLILFFSFFILTSTVFANTANPRIGGWQITSNIGQGIGAKLTASKDIIVNGASVTMTSVANVTPDPSKVAKFIAKVGAVSVVVDAMDLILDGVDYVMDPVNNSVTYNKPNTDPMSSKCQSTQSCSAYSTLWQDGNYPQFGIFTDRLALARYSVSQRSPTHTATTNYRVIDDCVYYDGLDGNNAPFQRALAMCGGAITNPNYDPSAIPNDDSKPVTVPLSEVGSRVIEQAEKDIKAGNPTSPAVVLARAVAQDMVGDQAGTDDNVKPVPPIAQELAKNAAIPEEGTATGEIAPTEANPEGSSFAMQFPSFCGWASTICTFIDWVKTDPDLEELELPEEELDEQEIEDDKIRISSTQCKNIDVDLGQVVFGDSFKMTYQMSEICSAISPLKHVLKLVTFLACLLILWRY